MNDVSAIPQAVVRDDFVPAEHYTSAEFLKLEKRHVFPRVWQIACREQDVREAGSYYVHDFLDESVIVARTEDGRLRAFHNVCSHRGRRLVSGCGKARGFRCQFHGWRYALDGAITEVPDRIDWQGCPDFADEDLGLQQVRVDTWGGWVFVNLDRDAEALRDYLAPLPEYLDPYELEAMSYRWHATVRVPCNWKVALEAFNEAYHVAATHPQMLWNYGDDRTSNRIFGKHGKFYYEPNPAAPLGAPAPRMGREPPQDYRGPIADYFELYNSDLNAFFTPRDVEASRRVVSELDASASPWEVLGKAIEFQREAAIASGAGWPDLTPEQMAGASTDWHVFPNHVFLPWPTGILGYRALPHTSDPDVCFFDVYALQRYAPGFSHKHPRMLFLAEEDWREFRTISRILQQDIDNMMDVQKGLKSSGFRGNRTNPVQEATVSNFHRVLLDYIHRGETA